MDLLRFRAWDTTNKEMFKDTFAITESGQVVVVEQESIVCPPDYVFVDHLVIMQSTSLRDMNNREIFEGDIISDGHTSRDIRHHQTLGFYTIDGNGVEEFFGDTASLEDFEETSKYMSENIEIIGNIYENKELLDA